MIKAAALLSPVMVTLFWAIVFFTQKQSSKSKTYLGFLMMSSFFLYMSHAVFFSRLYNIYCYMESLYLLSMLSAYPMFYIYLQTEAGEKPTCRQQLLQFIPAFIFSILSLVTALFMTENERIFYVQDTLINKNLSGLQLNTFTGIKGFIFFAARLTFIIQVACYIYKAIKLVNIHNKRIRDYYSNVEGKTLQWAKGISIVIIFVALASISFAIIGRSYFTRHEVSLVIPSAIFTSVLYFIGLKGNMQVPIREELILKKTSDDPEPQMDIQVEQLKAELLRLFDEEQVFKLPDLKIPYVSELLKTNRTYLSRLINVEFNMNFNEFVNKYRITTAKDLLCGEKNNSFTMEYIAEKSGFGSVNSFTRVFKEAEGKTPGKYRAECINKKYSQKQEAASE